MKRMASLTESSSSARFFGLNLTSLWRDLRTAWSGMLNWRIVSWLWPQIAVRLWQPNGTHMLTHGALTTPISGPSGERPPRFEAVQLPEELLLRRTLGLPRLQPAELKAALALEVQSLSPFTPEDTVWVYESALQNPTSLQVDLVLTARKLIGQHIESRHPQLVSQTPEVWVLRPQGDGFLVLPGYGEAQRQRQGLLWRWASALLLLLALTIIASMAVTPSVQLYLRALQANRAMQALQQIAGPVVAQRESMQRANEQLDHLTAAIGAPVPTLQVLQLITQALPDDTFLQSLKIQGLVVNITGQTTNSATLMKQLGATAGLRDVKAPVPATKPPGAPRESFAIEFTLEPGKVGATP